MSFAVKHEMMIRRVLVFLLTLIVLFGSVYSPLYMSTAMGGESLTNNKYRDDNYYDKSTGRFYRIYPASAGVIDDANGETDGVNGILSITAQDLGLEGNDPFNSFVSWLLKVDTYYFVAQDSSGCTSPDTNSNVDHVVPYFNVPSFQKCIQNYANTLLPIGGFDNRERQSWAHYDQAEWTTTCKKYGWDLPNVTYVGENPIVMYDAGEALDSITGDPIGVITFGLEVALENYLDRVIGPAVRFITGDNDIHITLKESPELTEHWEKVLSVIGSIQYANDDYVLEENSRLDRIVYWLYIYSQDSRFHQIHSAVIGEVDAVSEFFNGLIGKGLDDDGSKFFTSWVKYKVDEINNHGKDWSAQEIQALRDSADISDLTNSNVNSNLYIFKEEMMKSFGSNLNTIIEILGSDTRSLEMGFPIGSAYLRYMPYNYEQMSPASQEALGDTVDPRFEMWGTTNMIEGRLGNLYKSFIGTGSGLVIWAITAISHLASTLNSLCSFQFLDDIGFDMAFLWRGEMGILLIFLAGGALVFLLVRQIIKVVKGDAGVFQILGKALSCVVCLGILTALVAQPDYTVNTAKDLVSKASNVGTTLFNTTTLKGWDELYADDASQDDKSELRYWALAYSAWALYNTNHAGLGDSSSEFNIDHNDNVYVHLDKSPASLSSGESNLWPIVLMDYQFKDDNGMYRVIDHYMAPSFHIENGNLGYPIVKAEENPIYNGYVQSFVPYQYLVIVISILFLTFIKFVFFVEVVMELFLFLVRLASSVVEGNKGIKESCLRILRPMGKVIILDMIVSIMIVLIMQLSASASDVDITLNCLTVLTLFGMFWFIKQMVTNRNFFLKPAIFTAAWDFSKRTAKAAISYATQVDADMVEGTDTTILGKKLKKSKERKERREANSYAKQVTDKNKMEKSQGYTEEGSSSSAPDNLGESSPKPDNPPSSAPSGKD